MSEQKLFLDCHIANDKGPLLRPTSFTLQEKTHTQGTETTPLPFLQDMIFAVSYFKLRSQFNTESQSASLINRAWKVLDTNQEIFSKSQERVQSLVPKSGNPFSFEVKRFEDSLQDILKSAFQNEKKFQKFQFEDLFDLIDSLTFLEQRIATPLVYNFQLQFSPASLEKLNLVHSLLFHLRSLLIFDYNQNVRDASFESLAVDPVHDYLPRAEWVVNDTLVINHFHTLCKKWKTLETDWADFEKTLITPFEKVLQHFCHNGYFLWKALPQQFLSTMTLEEAEETLFMAQMDWLLGTPTGLLFRIREELYGLKEGYEKIFWPHRSELMTQPHSHLEFKTLITENFLSKQNREAV